MSNALKVFKEEVLDTSCFSFTEEQANKGGAKVLKIRGPYIFTGVMNLNNRMYYDENIQRVVSEYDVECIKNDRALGELGHPKTDVIRINYDRVCHNIISLKKQHSSDNFWIGESRILTGTPCGDLLAGLVVNGVKVGVSLRGAGEMDDRTKMVTLEKLITVDVVSDPSNAEHGAWCNGIFESRQYMLDTHGQLVEMAYNKLDKSLEKLPRKSDERKAAILAAINTFVKSI